MDNFINTSLQPLLPNIVIMHREFTFDPNLAFKLNTRANLPLWDGVPGTIEVGPLVVNIVGGGSWVTDFEGRKVG